MDLVLGMVYGLIGLILFCAAHPFSRRYNAWTTRLRERHPKFNPPPTPEWRPRNTKIMTVMFRIAGILLILISVTSLLHVIAAKH